MREGKGVEVDYEGMGTCIEAYLFVNGVRVCTIGAASTQMNDWTSRIVAAAKRELQQCHLEDRLKTLEGAVARKDKKPETSEERLRKIKEKSRRPSL